MAVRELDRPCCPGRVVPGTLPYGRCSNSRAPPCHPHFAADACPENLTLCPPRRWPFGLSQHRRVPPAARRGDWPGARLPAGGPLHQVRPPAQRGGAREACTGDGDVRQRGWSQRDRGDVQTAAQRWLADQAGPGTACRQGMATASSAAENGLVSSRRVWLRLWAASTAPRLC